jgi:hypothetical protein
VLFNILRAKSAGANVNNLYNPKRVVYIDGKPAKNQQTANPSSGFADSSTDESKQGGFFDPWSNEYVVWVDASGDNYCNLSSYYSDSDLNTTITSGGTSKTGPYIKGGVISASVGKDGKFGTKGNGVLKGSDDVASWQ